MTALNYNPFFSTATPRWKENCCGTFRLCVYKDSSILFERQIFFEGANLWKNQEGCQRCKVNKQYLLWITVKHALLCCRTRQSKSLQLQCVLMFTTISGTEPENHSQINNCSSLLLDIHLQPMKHALISISFFSFIPKVPEVPGVPLKKNGNRKQKRTNILLCTSGSLHANYSFANHCQAHAKFCPSTTEI